MTARSASRDATTSFVRTLVDEWARGGVRFAALAPGSRSTPLAIALASDDRIRLEVFLDERSAAFFALGCARGDGRPAVVLSTSGTAAVNFHPAVVEADHSRVPLIVCTADRPPELRDVGAGQTIDQTHLYGRSVRWFSDPGPPEDRPGVGELWRSFAARSVCEATGVVPGPVHLNLPFREPLVPTGAPLVEAPGRADDRPWTAAASGDRPDEATRDAFRASVDGVARGVVVAGWGASAGPDAVEEFAGALGWPVLADPLSGLRTDSESAATVSTYDLLLRRDELAQRLLPDLVVQLGAMPTSKAAAAWMEGAARRVVVSRQGCWPDPGRSADLVVHADADELLRDATDRLRGSAPSDANWLAAWHEAESAARRVVDEVLDGSDDPVEPRIARDVVAAPPDGTTLVVASSMPVRDVETFAANREGLRIVANRGANGIDGFVSTALGVAAASDGATVALLGDLCLLHDSNGLLRAVDRGIDLLLVVIDNDGGGIFSFLPQASHPSVSDEHFEEVFGTPHGLDVGALAALHRIPVELVDAAGELRPRVTSALEGGGVRMVVVSTDRVANVEHHRRVQRAVDELF